MVNEQTFSNEVSAFRRWADGLGDGMQRGEWELEYPAWPALSTAFENLLLGSSPDTWSSQCICDLLYAIARDNECELLAQSLLQKPEALLRLAEAALTSNEFDVRWQLALQLGYMPASEMRAAQLLVRFFHDDETYVQFCALLSLGRGRFPDVELAAVEAWAKGEERLRSATIEALNAANSPLLEQYIKAAEEDGRPALRAAIFNVRSAQAFVLGQHYRE